MRSDPSLVFPLFNTISWRWLNLASIHWNCWFAWIPYLPLHSLTLISIPKVIVIVSKGIAKFLCWSESNSGFWYPPLSLSMTELSCCLCGCELLLHPFPLMWKILQFIWVPWASRHLCETFVPPRTMAPLLSGLDNSHPDLVMMYLGLVLTEVGEKLKISCCRESNLLSTITILSLPPSKLSLSPRKSCDKLISESVYVEHDISGGVLEELLLLWMITFQSVCLVPWMLLSPCVGFPGIDSVLWVSP